MTQSELLATKRLEMIRSGFLPTGKDSTVPHTKGFRVFENWKGDGNSIMIIIDFLKSGEIVRIDWITL